MAWHKYLVLGVLGSALAVGCTVTTGDGGGGGDGGDGGDGGRSTGGRTGSGGRTGTGGASTGGTEDAGAGGSMTVDGGGGSGGEFIDAAPASCDPEGDDGDCLTCVKMNCCTEWQECNDDVCAGDGTEADPGEANCIITCMNDALEMDSFIDESTLNDCSDMCTKGSIIGLNTNDLIACIRAPADDAGITQLCSFECFGSDL